MSGTFLMSIFGGTVSTALMFEPWSRTVGRVLGLALNNKTVKRQKPGPELPWLEHLQLNLQDVLFHQGSDTVRH